MNDKPAPERIGTGIRRSNLFLQLNGLWMTDGYVKFKNDQGVAEIGIGVKEFKCAGETPPQDHPHVYLNMGDNDSILCPYCATNFIYRAHLGRHETEPTGNFFEEQPPGT